MQGCQVSDHVIETDDKNYLTFTSDSKKDKIKSWPFICFSEDLEHFWRNKDLILKESKLPDVTTIAKIQNFEVDESFEEVEDIFIDAKSRY